jgi:hypothetical protein
MSAMVDVLLKHMLFLRSRIREMSAGNECCEVKEAVSVRQDKRWRVETVGNFYQSFFYYSGLGSSSTTTF